MTCFAAMLAPLKDGHLQMELVGTGYTNPGLKRVIARYAEADPNTDPADTFYFNNWSGVSTAWNSVNYDFWTGTISGYFTNTDVTTVNPGSPGDFFHIATGRKILEPNSSDYILYLYLSKLDIITYFNLPDPSIRSVLRQFMSDLVSKDCTGAYTKYHIAFPSLPLPMKTPMPGVVISTY
jgi:hypothetical protein